MKQKILFIILLFICIENCISQNFYIYGEYDMFPVGSLILNEDGTGTYVYESEPSYNQDFNYKLINRSGMMFFDIEEPYITDYEQGKKVTSILLLSGMLYDDTSGKARRIAYGYTNITNKNGLSIWLILDVPMMRFEGLSGQFKDCSSFLKERTKEYPVDNLNIREPDTPWVEAGKGYGIGEGFTISNNSNKTFKTLFMMNGYISYAKPYLYKQNGRVKKLKITGLTSGKSQTVYVLDTPHPQTIDISFITDIEDIRVEIADSYHGTKYEDTCINYCVPFTDRIVPLFDVVE